MTWMSAGIIYLQRFTVSSGWVEFRHLATVKQNQSFDWLRKLAVTYSHSSRCKGWGQTKQIKRPSVVTQNSIFYDLMVQGESNVTDSLLNQLKLH